MDKPEKKVMTDAERLELAAKLDRELDEFIAGLEKKPYTEGWPEDKWEEEMEKHPFFMKNAPEPGAELHPLYEGLQQLKYDPNENTPEELALSYKEDGNFNFKHKNYRLAIIAYTEGIKIKCENTEIEASLLNNRSAANYYLKNYRSSLRDCELTLKLKPDHEKALVRAANCSYEIQQYEKAVEYCNLILDKNKDNISIFELKQKSIKAAKIRDRNKRMKEKAESKRTKEEQQLLDAVKSRGVKIFGFKDDSYELEDLKPVLPQLADFRVRLNEENKLVWPVAFMYPEYKVMDFVQQFCEDENLYDQLCSVFEEKPEWDTQDKYLPDNLNVYFKNHDTNGIYAVDLCNTLEEILRNQNYIIHNGAPSFIIVPKKSKAEEELLHQHIIA